MVQTLAVFAVGALLFLGIYLLVQRAREAARRRAEPFKGLYENRNKQFVEKLLKEDAGQPPNAAQTEPVFHHSRQRRRPDRLLHDPQPLRTHRGHAARRSGSRARRQAVRLTRRPDAT
jgi:hypothetical protein